MDMLQVQHLPGRGRGLVTTRLVKAGEIILKEAPVLLTVNQDVKEVFCANCLRQLRLSTGKPSCSLLVYSAMPQSCSTHQQVARETPFAMCYRCCGMPAMQAGCILLSSMRPRSAAQT